MATSPAALSKCLMRELIPVTGDEIAECAKPSTEPDWWFDEETQELAKAICSNCPLVEACLRYALSNKEEHGVWGGMTAEERWKLRKRKAAH